MRGAEQIPWLYDGMCWLLERGGLTRWRHWLARGARGRTLDIGVGTGRNLPYYSSEVPVVALDRDAVMLARARRRGPGMRFVVGDAQALPFADGTFDTVVSGLVFCSVPDPAAGLREIRRILASEGTLRMLEHVRADGWVGRLQDLVQPAWTWCAGGCHPNRRTEDLVSSSGFRIQPEERRRTRTMRRFIAKPA